MNVLLDTNVLIYLFENNFSVISFLEKQNIDNFSVSIVTWMEFMVGAKKHGRLNLNDEVFSIIKVFNLDLLIAQAVIKYLESKSKSLRFDKLQDAIIANTAIVYNLPLITNNPKDFRCFKGLKIIPLK